VRGVGRELGGRGKRMMRRAGDRERRGETEEKVGRGRGVNKVTRGGARGAKRRRRDRGPYV